MSNRSCKTCSNCGSTMSPEGELRAICRAKPPAVFTAPIPHPRGGIAWVSSTAWPLIGPEDWCNEYQPAITMS